MGSLTKTDLESFKINQDKAIEQIKVYASQYKGALHYNELGASCATSISRTINTIIFSANHLEGHFVAADEIDIDQVVEWFMQSKEYICERNTVAFYMAHYLKRKVNEFYRSVRNNSILGSTSILSNKQAKKELMRIYKNRSELGVRQIRISK